MNEEFDVVKSELNAIENLEDIWENPVVQFLYGMLNIAPGPSRGIGSFISELLVDRQKKKQAELCTIIFSDNTITKDDIKDVTVIMEFARTLDVVNRLASNEKVTYIAKLFKKTFSNELNRDNISEYEEYLRRLDFISCREIDLLFLLFNCENDPEIFPKKSVSKIDEAWKLFKEKATKEYGIEEKIIVDIISGLTMTGFCREANIMFPDGDNENPYYTTEYFKRFLNLIS